MSSQCLRNDYKDYLCREYWTEGKENEKKVIKSSSVVITTIMHATSLIKYFKVSPFPKLH